MGFDMSKVASASDFLTKDDTDFNGMNITISAVTQEEVGQEKEQKYAIHFHEPVKAMILNVTNIKILCALFGPNSDQWMNQRVCVYTDPTISFGGNVVGGLRVRPCQIQAPPAQAGLAQPQAQAGPAHASVPPQVEQPPQQHDTTYFEQQAKINQAKGIFATPSDQFAHPNSTGEDVPW